MRLARYYCFLCLSLLCFESDAQQQIQSGSLDHTLDSLKKTDNLTDWLYCRIDYGYANPKQNLAFLMNTEKLAWRAAKTQDEKEAMMILYSNQAYNQLFSGNILESIDRYEKAYNYYTEHRLNVAGIAEYIFKPWANNYTRLGDYQKALFIQKQTLAYGIKEKDKELIAGSYNNIAISLRSLGNLRDAEKQVKMGISHLPDSSSTLALLTNTLTDIYKDSKQIQLAEETIIKNIAFQQQRRITFESAYWLLSSYISAGDIQLLKRNYKEAQRFYQQALEINNNYYDGDRLREKAYIITQLGVIRLAAQQPIEAMAYFEQTLATLGIYPPYKAEQLFGDNRLIDVLYQRSIAYQKMGNDVAALENLMLSLSAADKIRFELSDVKTKQRFQADTKRKAETAIDLAFALLQKTKEGKYGMIILDLVERTKSRTLLDDIRRNTQQFTKRTNNPLFNQKQNLERAIAYNERESLLNPENAAAIAFKTEALKFRLESTQKQLNVKYPSLSGNQNLNFTAAQTLANLPPGSHVLDYFFGQQNIYALEIRNRKIRQVRKITAAATVKNQITAFVDQYYRHGPDAMMEEPKSFYSASYQIYQTLIGGLKLSRGGHLTIVPDEVLGYLSFDGLITKNQYLPSISSWPYLIHQYNISYGFSLGTLINQSRNKNSIASFTGLFITHENLGNKYIPSVAKEAEAIEKKVAGRFLLDEEANTLAFNQAFESSSVLHLSTHAYLSGRQKEPALAFYNNSIFLFELFSRKKSPVLVVLSACRTADGSMAEGEGIISLSRGFTALGTQGTIGALWNVNDAAAAMITANCYQQMLEEKKISMALHRAKLQWLHGNRSSEHEYLPYYWDALVYMGHDQVIELQPAQQHIIPKNLIGVIVASVAVMLISLISIRWRLKQGWSKK